LHGVCCKTCLLLVAVAPCGRRALLLGWRAARRLPVRECLRLLPLSFCCLCFACAGVAARLPPLSAFCAVRRQARAGGARKGLRVHHVPCCHALLLSALLLLKHHILPSTLLPACCLTYSAACGGAGSPYYYLLLLPSVAGRLERTAWAVLLPTLPCLPFCLPAAHTPTYSLPYYMLSLCAAGLRLPIHMHLFAPACYLCASACLHCCRYHSTYLPFTCWERANTPCMCHYLMPTACLCCLPATHLALPPCCLPLPSSLLCLFAACCLRGRCHLPLVHCLLQRRSLHLAGLRDSFLGLHFACCLPSLAHMHSHFS